MTGTRPARLRTRARVGLALGAVLVLGALGLASASTLGITSRGPAVVTASSPCSGTARVEPAVPTSSAQVTTSAVRVDLPTGCTGSHTVQVALDTGNGIATGSGLISSGGTIDVGQVYTATTTMPVTTTLDGWSMTSTWSFPIAACTVPGSTTATCEVALTWTGGPNLSGNANLPAAFTVSTTSTTPVAWQVTIWTSRMGNPLNRMGNSSVDGYSDGLTTWSSSGNVNDVDAVWCSKISGSAGIAVEGRPSGPANNRFETVVAGRDRYFLVMVNGPQSGADIRVASCS
ncbi:hypothetical protein [Actinotalea sp.]|uniref:hypothetical protein n=1 Tax=Actinotalea sp. TaxID=1872145 RepID=UPI0035667928